MLVMLLIVMRVVVMTASCLQQKIGQALLLLKSENHQSKYGSINSSSDGMI